MTTTAEQPDAILRQTYSKTLDKLEYFLGACRFNRHLVPYYAQIMGPLQSLKTLLFKKAPKSGTSRRRFAESTQLPEPSDTQHKSFELIKKIISSRETMVHPDYDLPFYWYL